MAENPIAQVLSSQKELEELKKKEQIKRSGFKFIDVIYRGDTLPDFDAEGNVVNIRIHGANDVQVYEEVDYSKPGNKKYIPNIVSSVIKLRQDPVTGEVIGTILDDEHNRHFLATHPEFEIVSVSVRKEIEALVGKKYDIEPDKETELKRTIEKAQKELAALEKERPEPEEPRKRLTRNERMNQNNNQG